MDGCRLFTETNDPIVCEHFTAASEEHRRGANEPHHGDF